MKAKEAADEVKIMVSQDNPIAVTGGTADIRNRILANIDMALEYAEQNNVECDRLDDTSPYFDSAYSIIYEYTEKQLEELINILPELPVIEKNVTKLLAISTYVSGSRSLIYGKSDSFGNILRVYHKREYTITIMLRGMNRAPLNISSLVRCINTTRKQLYGMIPENQSTRELESTMFLHCWEGYKFGIKITKNQPTQSVGYIKE